MLRGLAACGGREVDIFLRNDESLNLIQVSPAERQLLNTEKCWEVGAVADSEGNVYLCSKFGQTDN